MIIDLLPQIVVNGLLLGVIYILISTGFNLCFGIMKMVNFAHGTIYMLGAFAVFTATNLLNLNYFLGLIIAVLFTFCLGLLIERILLRGKIIKDILAFIIITLGLLYVFTSSALIIFGERPKGVKSPISGVLNIWDVSLPLERLLPTIIALVLVVLLHLFLKFTKTGQSLRAVADDSDTASLMGINVTKTYSLGFALGSALAGPAGALIAPLFIIEIGMGAKPLWKCFIVVLLGGMGSLPGSVLAGLFLGLMDSVLGTLVSATMASIVGFIAIILILMFKPEGLMGQKLDV